MSTTTKKPMRRPRIGEAQPRELHMYQTQSPDRFYLYDSQRVEFKPRQLPTFYRKKGEKKR